MAVACDHSGGAARDWGRGALLARPPRRASAPTKARGDGCDGQRPHEVRVLVDADTRVFRRVRPASPFPVDAQPRRRSPRPTSTRTSTKRPRRRRDGGRARRCGVGRTRAWESGRASGGCLCTCVSRRVLVSNEKLYKDQCGGGQKSGSLPTPSMPRSTVTTRMACGRGRAQTCGKGRSERCSRQSQDTSARGGAPTIDPAARGGTRSAPRHRAPEDDSCAASRSSSCACRALARTHRENESGDDDDRPHGRLHQAHDLPVFVRGTVAGHDSDGDGA